MHSVLPSKFCTYTIDQSTFCFIVIKVFGLISTSVRSFNFFRADGLYLIEVDRVLRPGGYWILSGPPIHWKKHYKGWERTQEDLKQEQNKIEDVARRLCWTKVIEKDDLAIWQKPMNHIECVNSRKTYNTPHMCKDDNPDAAW